MDLDPGSREPAYPPFSPRGPPCLDIRDGAEILHSLLLANVTACRAARLSRVSPSRAIREVLSQSHGLAEVRYIWVNFQHDIIHLPDAEIHKLEPYGAVIQRLGFTVLPTDPALSGGDDELWFLFSDEILEPFTALKELHISIPENYLQWGSIARSQHVSFRPPGRENVRFIDPHTGLSLNPDQYAIASRWYTYQGGKVCNMNDIDEELAHHARSGYRDFDLSAMAEVD
ncbi:hypothetical protein F5X97DRAFT_317031 [Nemania serpens]|nr:hypothetical protein F5X97DRAFT_317031 [Nemania serpens]